MFLEFLTNIFSFIENNFIFITVCMFLTFLFFGSFLNVFLYRGNLKEINNNILMIEEYLDEQGIAVSDELRSRATQIKLSEMSLSFPASHCPKCNNPLKWWHNIPLLSYILLKGKCHFCQEKISMQYPLVEAFTAIVLTGSWIVFYNLFGSAVFLAYMLAMIVSWMILLFDYKYYTIPDGLVYFLLWSGLLFSLFDLTQTTRDGSILGAVAGFMSLWVIAKIGKLVKGQDAMGGGDLKLLAALGAWIGPLAILPIIGISAFVGIATFLIFKFIHKNDKTEKQNMLPYGPSLIISFWIVLIYGEEILSLFK